MRLAIRATHAAEFLLEAGVLSRLSHPHVLGFFGVAVLPPRLLSHEGSTSLLGLVVEFCAGGNFTPVPLTILFCGRNMAPSE